MTNDPPKPLRIIPIQTMDGTARPLMAFQTKKKDVLHKRSPQTAVMIIYDY